MNDPQIWTLIGVVATLIFASNRQLSTSIRREMAAGFRTQEAKIDAFAGGLDAKIDSVAGGLDTKIDSVAASLDAKIDSVSAQLETKLDMGFMDVNHRLDSLEADMRLIKAHLIGQSSVTQARG